MKESIKKILKAGGSQVVREKIEELIEAKTGSNLK